jgi:hypothetical protein
MLALAHWHRYYQGREDVMPATYDLLLPKRSAEQAGLSFRRGNYINVKGTINKRLMLAFSGSMKIGSHASNDGEVSLCGLKLVTKAVTGPAEDIAMHVTCQFCQARLLSAGVLLPKAPLVTDYALDYGTRDTRKELNKINGTT